jgi:signal transduction histidine kinase
MIASSLHVSDLFYGRIAGQYIIVLSRRILDVQDKPVGVVAVALKPQYIEDVLSGLHLPPGSYAAILDRQNVFVSRVPEGDKWIGKSASAFPINEVPSALERSTADFVGNDGVQRLYVSYTLPEAGWKIYTGTPSEVLMSRHRQWAFWAIALTLALAIVSGFIAYTIASRLAREFNRMLAAEQQLSTRLLRAEEVERRRISLELHDQVGQELTALAMDLKLLRPETAPSTVNRSLAAVDRLIDSVRDVTLTLRPPQLDDLGLLAALRSHVAHYVQPRGIAVHLDFDGVRVARLSSDLEAACFRIVQEALTNVLRHAEARNVWISLRHCGDELVLRLRDDGRGFDYAATLSALGEGRSLGLRNLLDRAQLVGGRLAIRSVPGGGTELEGKFPL